jgi:hypothetical protein
VLAVFLLALVPAPAGAITPQDPAVQKAVDNALAYLLRIRPEERPIEMAGAVNSEIGMQCLVAAALLKHEPEQYREHPLVKQAVANLRGSIRSGTINNGYYTVYTLGMGLVMFSALKDKEGAQTALKELLKWQRDHGGFTAVTGWGGGDTSMTQYAVLGMWEAAQIGVVAPPQAWQRAAGWLMQTQLEHGTYAYNPGALTSGLMPAYSMTAAGLSSLYICANYARPGGRAGLKPPEDKKQGESDVPSALVPLSEKKKDAEKEKGAAGRVNLDLDRLQAALSRGDNWMDKNFDDSLSLQQWQLYYLYAAERYYSFREKWEGVQPEEPEWYTKGARFLVQKQRIDGSWGNDYNERAAACFGLLFLVRGTKKGLTVSKPEETAGGTLFSGSGLPTDLTNVRIKDGQIVAKPLAGPAGELLEIMEKPDDPRFLAAIEGMQELVVKADDIMLSPHLVRLRKMAKNASPEARAAAVALLGQSRDLDYVPTLIFALRDEDQRVIRAAWEALKFVSRRSDAFGMSPNFPGDDDQQRTTAKEKAIERWQAWYRSVRPDAEFEE